MGSEWVRFSDIGNKLADWMQILWRTDAKCSNVDALLVSSHYREFEARFSGIFCTIGDAGKKILDDYEASLESQHQIRAADQQHTQTTSITPATSVPNAVPSGVMVPVI
ncbi:hypothetical protein F441_20211 [Phytophthora nicotianae CJ01A1]|uniref:Uncharacterized protein n=1 Tax=Phytophthora nicotianae CJ01A1 TaxID=1317063 RepID=W2VWX4_PHYNI|nr:hypothetical protein F441_20211 [Phytophthora nicotianae CJ01A1]